MFQPFERSTGSWGNLAHLDESTITQGLNSLGALKTLGQHNKSTAKQFGVKQLKTIGFTITSDEATVYAQGMDAASNMARDVQFQFNGELSNEIYEKIHKLITENGFTPTVNTRISTSRKSK